MTAAMTLIVFGVMGVGIFSFAYLPRG